MLEYSYLGGKKKELHLKQIAKLFLQFSTKWLCSLPTYFRKGEIFIKLQSHSASGINNYSCLIFLRLVVKLDFFENLTVCL